MHRWVSAHLGVGLSVLLASASVPAQDAPSMPPPGSVPVNATMARIQERVVPEYPEFPRVNAQEGWVVLSFVVTPEGAVVDPIVEDSSGQILFEKAALQAAARQRYTPAMVDGKPVEQCATKVKYTFAIPDLPNAARLQFRKKHKQVLALMEAGDRAEAAAAIDRLLSAGTWNLYELHRLELLRYENCRATADRDCMLDALTRATVNDGADLEPDLYRQSLEARAALEIGASQYAEALATIERRRQLSPPLPPDHPLNLAAAELRNLISGPANLVFTGKVGYPSGCEVGAPHWRHELLRREFALDPVAGTLDKVEIRCDWRRATDTVSSDKTWKVPASWGSCVVFVFGSQDAQVRLVEYPQVAGGP